MSSINPLFGPEMKGTAFGEGVIGWEGVSSTPELNQPHFRSHHVVLAAVGIGINCAGGAGTVLPEEICK